MGMKGVVKGTERKREEGGERERGIERKKEEGRNRKR